MLTEKQAKIHKNILCICIALCSPSAAFLLISIRGQLLGEEPFPWDDILCGAAMILCVLAFLLLEGSFIWQVGHAARDVFPRLGLGERRIILFLLVGVLVLCVFVIFFTMIAGKWAVLYLLDSIEAAINGKPKLDFLQYFQKWLGVFPVRTCWLYLG